LEHHGIPFDRFAREVGISRQTLYNWFDHHSAPNLAKKLGPRLSEALQEPAAYILYGQSPLSIGGHLKSGELPEREQHFPRATVEQVASRFADRKSPATRKDCENYFQALMTAAEISDDPNAWPVILHRLRREFPLDEWGPPAPPDPERK
jgi:DNA-binding XRE family transcriptional regulator